MFPLSPDEAWKIMSVNNCYDAIVLDVEKSRLSPADEILIARINRSREAVLSNIRTNEKRTAA